MGREAGAKQAKQGKRGTLSLSERRRESEDVRRCSCADSTSHHVSPGNVIKSLVCLMCCSRGRREKGGRDSEEERLDSRRGRRQARAAAPSLAAMQGVREWR